jgi:ABC-type uncharacterized transport system involved in gliding motility auxiliary subunit
MEITRRTRLLLRLQGVLSTLLFIGVLGMLAWLSTRYVYQADWTAGGRNTVTEDTRQLLDQLDQPVTITAFVRDDELLRDRILDLVGSYQRFKDDISLRVVNPDTTPERVRQLGISVNGELVVDYMGRTENIQSLSERQLTNTLLRLSRRDERWIVFLAGHGEREPGGETNYGLGVFARELERKGLNVQTINLAETTIPDNTHLLVLASPRVDLLPGEVALLREYVDGGGNLLWLAEPGNLHGLEPLAEQLGIEFLPGMVVDATTRLFGVENPSFVVITSYPHHEITAGMNTVTVFPEAVALEGIDAETWTATPLLTTLERSWTELGALEGEIRFDEDTDERPGPLDIGIILTRTPAAETAEAPEPREQRIIVIGDGDFLSSTYLGNAGNLDLGLNMVHWLSHDDALIDIRITTAPDVSLELGTTAQAVIGIGFLFGLPALLFFSGIVVWLRRRRR